MFSNTASAAGHPIQPSLVKSSINGFLLAEFAKDGKKLKTNNRVEITIPFFIIIFLVSEQYYNLFNHKATLMDRVF